MKKNQRVSERRRRMQRRRRLCTASNRCFFVNGGHNRSTFSCSNSKVSDKLEALKSLIPSPEGVVLKADQLYEQTADYIVRLRTQIAILQTLIQVYGTSDSDNGVAVS